jgi:hypothetical protein
LLTVGNGLDEIDLVINGFLLQWYFFFYKSAIVMSGECEMIEMDNLN